MLTNKHVNNNTNNIDNNMDNKVCLLSTFPELQCIVAEGALTPEVNEIAVLEHDSKHVVISCHFHSSTEIFI